MNSRQSRPRSIPTEKQASKLWILGSGSIALAPGRGDWGPLVRRGWVELLETDDTDKRYYPPLRITAAGLHALAEAVAFDGLDPEPFKCGQEPSQLDEHPHVTDLKAKLAEARAESDKARRDFHYADARLRKIHYAMEGFKP